MQIYVISILEANSVPLLCKPAKFYANFMPVSMLASYLGRARARQATAAATAAARRHCVLRNADRAIL